MVQYGLWKWRGKESVLLHHLIYSRERMQTWAWRNGFGVTFIFFLVPLPHYPAGFYGTISTLIRGK